MSTAQTPVSPVRSPASYVALGMAILATMLAVLALAWVVTRDRESTTSVQGSGVAVADARELPPFSAVELAGVNQVTIGVGGEQHVTVRGDDNVVGLVTTTVRDGVLVIDQAGSVDPVTPLGVELTVPSLDGVRLSGSGAIAVDGHELEALSVELPGAGAIRAAGTVSRLDVDVAGTGEADLGQLVARDATVVVSGTGAVFVHATGMLQVDVSGTGSVVYSGDPDHVDRKITGTGSVTEGQAER